MINFRPALIAMTTTILASSAPVPAMALPIDSDPPVATRKITFPDSSLRCPLLRIPSAVDLDPLSSAITGMPPAPVDRGRRVPGRPEPLR